MLSLRLLNMFKLKIKWGNLNPIFDSVCIYKSSILFDTSSLPAVYAEISNHAVTEYEDLNVIDGEKWFYMLSTRLDDREEFTECFEITIDRDVERTLAIQPTFLTPSLWVSGWNTETGDFKVWKSGITATLDSSINSMKIYAAPYRKASDGPFYYELTCTKVVNPSGVELTTYPSDNMFGLMQNGSSVNVNSSGFNNENSGYGRFLLRNNGANIEGAGALVSVGSDWSVKLSAKQLQQSQIWGIGIRASGSNTLVELWINGIYQGVMFTIVGTSIELRPLIIFTLENNYVKATHYQYPRFLSYLPDGYKSWLTAF